MCAFHQRPEVAQFHTSYEYLRSLIDRAWVLGEPCRKATNVTVFHARFLLDQHTSRHIGYVNTVHAEASTNKHPNLFK